MQEFWTRFWVALWTDTWTFGLAVFSVLTVLVIIFGGRDLVALLQALRARHLAQESEVPAEEGEATG